jgi:hypothetical protein
MSTIFTTIGGRKFAFAVTIAIGFFALACFDKISYEQLIKTIEWIFGAFVIGNVAQKFVK